MTTREWLYLTLLVIILALGILAHIAVGAEPVLIFDVNANTAGMRWDANTEQDMAHYTLYGHWGDSSAVLLTIDHPETTAAVVLVPRYYYERIGFTLTATDQSGNESAHSVMVEAIFCTDPGDRYADVNADGSVDVEDLEWCRASLGAEPWYAGWRERADVNADRIIDVEDLERIRTRLGR